MSNRPVTKGEAQRAQKALKKDYVPGGEMLRTTDLRWRRLLDIEPVMQCCKKTSCDIQSGPIFCGEIASYIAFPKEGSVVCLCEGHSPPKECLEES